MNDTLATTFELNELAAKLGRDEIIGEMELQLLEKAVSALAGTSTVSS